jgi:6-phosphogluconolactonase
VSFGVEVFAPRSYSVAAATRIAGLLPRSGSVVITGGGTARKLYPLLGGMGVEWSGVDVFFSDERCVPPDDDASNFGMAYDTLLRTIEPRSVFRIRGEDDPGAAAGLYADEIAPAVDAGLELTILGMGDDCHVCALFPGSPGLDEREALAIGVDRPDGMKGVTLTPPALAASRRVVVIVTGESKADAVRRAVTGDEPVRDCPVKLLDGLDVTFLLDEPAAARLD